MVPYGVFTHSETRRALLLGGAFKVVGVAPYFLFWLAPFAFTVVLVWTA